MKKMFGEFKLTWKFLILFSITIGLLVGIINEIPFLYNTSFRDIAIVLDMWIVLAIFIIINSKSAKEAMSKCFIFFLISQPIIYLIEVIIETLFNNKIFIDTLILYFKNFYIGADWFKLTILTIPGAFIAYQIKKDNILSALILSVATSYLSFRGINVIINSITNNFPYHILNGILCLFFAYSLIFLIFKNKKNKLISIILTSIGLLVGIILFLIPKNTPPMIDLDISLDNKKEIIEYKISDESIVKATLTEDGKSLIVSSSTNIGTATITIIDEDNNEYIYNVISTSKDFEVNIDN